MALLEKLRGVVGGANVLAGVDLSPFVVDGRTPEAVVFPGSVDEVASVVSLAAAAGTPVMPWGGGTAAAVGRPLSRTAIVLGLRRLDRVLEHEPGDLTVTVEAGITLAALQRRLREQGQWLSLDPSDADRATVGGILATNSSGPRRHLYGTARDLLIGLTVVTAEGAVVRGGGKVVKNVAGYDLPKLFIGSYGTLGVVVEASLKLRPVPDAERLVAARFEHLKDCGAAVRAVMGSDLIPSAIELLDPGAMSALARSGSVAFASSDPRRLPSATLVVGFDGLAEQLDWQVEELERVLAPFGTGPLVPVAASAWDGLSGLASAFTSSAAMMSFSVLPTLVTETVEQGGERARQRGLATSWFAHAGVGVVRGVLFAPAGLTDTAAVVALLGEWRQMARAGGGHASVEWAPLAVKAEVPVWDDPGPSCRIMKRIKEQLDPQNILNPGRFLADP